MFNVPRKGNSDVKPRRALASRFLFPRVNYDFGRDFLIFVYFYFMEQGLESGNMMGRHCRYINNDIHRVILTVQNLC